MGDSPARSGFGVVELEVDESTSDGFGELDLDFLPASDPEPPIAPPLPLPVDDRTRVYASREAEAPSYASASASGSGVQARDDDAPPPSQDPLAQMRELYARGDAAGALALAEQATAVDDSFGGLIPLDEDEPVRERDMTRIAAGIPRLLLSRAEASKLPIDPRAAFLLGFIDGMQTVEEILEVCAMPASEAMEVIRTLVAMKVIEIESSPSR